MPRAALRVLSALFLCASAESFALAQDGQSFAIQNIASGKDLRPFGAKRHDRNPIILYDHHTWKCLTWTFRQAGPERFRLMNRYTSKGLNVTSTPAAGTSLVQHGSPPESQAWDFIAQPDSSYAIRLAGSNLFITAASSETNALVTIEPFSGADSQKWRLIPQKPWF